VNASVPGNQYFLTANQQSFGIGIVYVPQNRKAIDKTAL
jgi:hypothetical protein